LLGQDFCFGAGMSGLHGLGVDEVAKLRIFGKMNHSTQSCSFRITKCSMWD